MLNNLGPTNAYEEAECQEDFGLVSQDRTKKQDLKPPPRISRAAFRMGFPGDGASKAHQELTSPPIAPVTKAKRYLFGPKFRS